MTTQPLAYRPEAAAAQLGVGRTTMYDLLRTGAIESVKVGRSRVIPADALVKYLDRLRAGAEATNTPAAGGPDAA